MCIAYLQRVFIPVFRYVKIKIHQYFPELRLQMYCHLFMVHSVYQRLIHRLHFFKTDSDTSPIPALLFC